MTESKHTPGPWTARELHPDGRIITMSGTYEISTPEYDVCATLPCGAPIRRLEDAALIAAAPELLEALELYVKWHNLEDDESLDDGSGLLFDAATAATAAIAKYKGGQQ